MYSADDAKTEAEREIDRLNSSFVFSINSNSAEVLCSEGMKDFLKTCRVATFVGAVLDEKISAIRGDSKDADGTKEEDSNVPRQFSDLGELVKSLPYAIPSIDEVDHASRKDSSVKQLQRDIERDSLIINGVKLAGSVGLDEVLSEMSRTIDAVFSTCQLPPLPAELKTEFSLVSLRKAARTNSGGQSFQALQNIVPITHQLVPQSSLASPLRILITLGSCSDKSMISSTHSSSNFPKIGLIGIVQAATVFSLEQVDHQSAVQYSDHSVSVSVLYENTVFVPFDSKFIGRPTGDVFAGTGKLTFDKHGYRI